MAVRPHPFLFAMTNQINTVIGNDFELWTPIEFIEKATDGGGSVKRIRGIASSESVDADGEVIDQDGIDWSYFLTKGHFTVEHPLGIFNIAGHPDKIERVDLGGVAATAVEGVLLDDKSGQGIWEKAKALKKAGGGRSLGFSIEGKALDRDSKDHKLVTKAKVTSVAITAAPKNPDSWFEPIAASMLARVLSHDYLARAESMGYPSQGAAAEGAGGLGKLAAQSLQGAKKKKPMANASFGDLLRGMTREDLMVARLLRNLNSSGDERLGSFTWSQGIAAIKAMAVSTKWSKK